MGWGIRWEVFNAVRGTSDLNCRGAALFFEIFLDLLQGQMFPFKCSEPFRKEACNLRASLDPLFPEGATFLLPR